jgi:hypothetical protein
MKKRYNLLFVLSVPVLFLFLTSEVLFPSGSPGGKSGSLGDGGANCTDCHAGTAQPQEGWIVVPELLFQGYNPGQTYGVSVIAEGGTNTFGFEATAENTAGDKVGSFQQGLVGWTQTINNNSAVTHTSAGSTAPVPGGMGWTFFWTAPATTVGDVTFYAAINVANGNGQNTGDQIYLSQFVVSPATGIFDTQAKTTIGLYPNPSTGIVYFDSQQSTSEELLEIYNLVGQVVYSVQVDDSGQSVDLSDLDKGMYIARLGDKTQQLILR